MPPEGGRLAQGDHHDPQRRHEEFLNDVREVFLPQELGFSGEMPVVDCETFGERAELVRKNIAALHRFLSLPVIPFRFTDHHAWSNWKKQMREKYGQELANQELRQLENNKLRVNKLAGLVTIGESLMMSFEQGDEIDRAFAVRLDQEWNPGEVLKAIEVYRALPVAEGVQRMKYFDEKAVGLIAMFSDEARRRREGKQLEQDSYYALAAK